MSTKTEDLIVDEIHEILKDKNLWTPEFLARKFIDLDEKKQMQFFVILSEITNSDSSTFVKLTIGEST